MSELVSKWNDILDRIKEEYEMTNVTFEAWIKPLVIDEEEDNRLVLMCEQEPAVNIVRKKYLEIIRVVIEEEIGIKYDIEIIGPNSKKNKPESKPNNKVNVLVTPTSDINGLNPNYTFETFVVGSNNRFAHAAALAVAESPGEEYNPLFLYGGVGLGKTHLMHSIGHYIQQNNPNMKILYVSSEVFTNELIDSIKNGNNNAMTKFREKYRNIDVLLIDDIQFIIGKDATQEEFFHTFNELRNCNKQVVISSDRHPSEMEKLEERIKSRLEWGLTADIKQPDYEMRMAILRKKKELDGFDLSDEVLDYIANNFKSNIRQLEGALNKLVAYSRLTRNTPITLDIAAEQLQNMIYPDKPHEVTIQMIVEVVCDHYGISIEQMLSANRSKDISDPRMIAMYLARELTNASQQQIGAFLGKRDHATVIHGIKKIEQRIKEDESLNSQIELIKKKINPD